MYTDNEHSLYLGIRLADGGASGVGGKIKLRYMRSVAD